MFTYLTTLLKSSFLVTEEYGQKIHIWYHLKNKETENENENGNKKLHF